MAQAGTPKGLWTPEPLLRVPAKPVAWAPAILLFVAVCLQIRIAVLVLPGDLAESDPPAHFTTGVMLHDFIRHPSFQPLPFAECFYVKYPKVAFGHWPPVFYVIEALWFFLFGTKIVAARWMCACIACGCTVALYRVCRRFWGWWHAAAISAVFLAAPVVERAAWRVMSDLLLAVLVFLAIVSFSDYLAGGKRKDAFWYAAWSVLAILTKGTGFLLFVIIAAGPLLSRRSRVYARLSYWLSITAICALTMPFYVWMSDLHFGYPTKIEGHLHRLATILSQLAVGKWVAGAFLLVVLAAALYRFRPRRETPLVGTLSVLLALWIASQTLLLILAPLTPEWDRYFMPSLEPAAFLLAGVAVVLDRWLVSRCLRDAKLIAALLCAAALALSAGVECFSTSAYSQAAASIPLSKEPQVILVESDSVGEGAIIAARLEEDPLRSSYLLRSSKLLSSSEWSTANYSLRYHDPAAVRAALESHMVDYVVIDHSARTPSAPLLETALHEPGWSWKPVARIPVVLATRRGELIVYRRESPAPSGRVQFSVQLGPERGGRTLTCTEPLNRP